MDKQLSKNKNPNFLVGNGITMADISLSQFILKYPLNEAQPDNFRKMYDDEMKKYPRVNNYANRTVKPAF